MKLLIKIINRYGNTLEIYSDPIVHNYEKPYPITENTTETPISVITPRIIIHSTDALTELTHEYTIEGFEIIQKIIDAIAMDQILFFANKRDNINSSNLKGNNTDE